MDGKAMSEENRDQAENPHKLSSYSFNLLRRRGESLRAHHEAIDAEKRANFLFRIADELSKVLEGVMPEVKLEWVESEVAGGKNFLIGEATPGSWTHPKATAFITGMGNVWVFYLHGVYYGYRADPDSAKAAVKAELLRRNESERVALEGLK